MTLCNSLIEPLVINMYSLIYVMEYLKNVFLPNNINEIYTVIKPYTILGCNMLKY